MIAHEELMGRLGVDLEVLQRRILCPRFRANADSGFSRPNDSNQKTANRFVSATFWSIDTVRHRLIMSFAANTCCEIRLTVISEAVQLPLFLDADVAFSGTCLLLDGCRGIVLDNSQPHNASTW